MAIDCKWLSNSQAAVDLIASWWKSKRQLPAFERCYQAESLANRGTALAFSLGVDSFYSCFFADPKPDILVFVAGFDTPLNDEPLLESYTASLRQVAEALNMQWALVRTNLRQHRSFRHAPWPYSHGGALAFIGHLLKPCINRFLISSSYDREHLGAYGSHPDLDPLWSSSDLNVIHFGEDTMRSEKFKRLVNHPQARPLIAKHLRVCWEDNRSPGNCGRCKKCVMTRINLLRDAPDLVIETMATDIPLAAAINALPALDLELSLNFRRELLDVQEPEVKLALQNYIRRSEAAIAQNPGLKKI